MKLIMGKQLSPGNVGIMKSIFFSLYQKDRNGASFEKKQVLEREFTINK